MNKQIDAMRKMGLNDSEINELLEYDKAVDKGTTTEYDYTPEQKKAAKEYRKTTSAEKKKPTVYKLDNTGGKKSKKENPVKAKIIQSLYQALTELVDINNLEIVNNERQLKFTCESNNFELTLTQKRK